MLSSFFSSFLNVAHNIITMNGMNIVMDTITPILSMIIFATYDLPHLFFVLILYHILQDLSSLFDKFLQDFQNIFFVIGLTFPLVAVALLVIKQDTTAILHYLALGSSVCYNFDFVKLYAR